MLTTVRILSVSLCVVGLSSCMIDGGTNSDSMNYQPNAYQNAPLYPEGYDNAGYYAETQTYKKEVMVPESYNVSAERAPIAPKNADKAWVAGQNPQGYTIEVAHDEKASRVAGTLQKAPKNERAAEVKYQDRGQVYYKGLYGSYPSQEAAQNALNALPDDIKQGSSIKEWGSIQNNLSE